MSVYYFTEQGYRVGLLLFKHKLSEIKWYCFIQKYKTWRDLQKYKLSKKRLLGYE